MATATVTIITILLFLGAGAWIFVMAYWILGRLGIWKWATYRRLNKRYKKYEFKEEIINWCLPKIKNQWKFKDIRTISKYETDRGERIYTYLMLTKLPKGELEQLIERRTG